MILTPTFLVGVDPGLSGSVVWWASWEASRIISHPMGASATELLEMTTEWDPMYVDSHKVVYIEEVSGFAGRPQPGSRMFKFGRNFGNLEMLFVKEEFEIRRVRPQTWQKHFSLLSRKGEEKPAHKKRLCALARELYPKVKVTMLNCDALLILRYGKETL
jgi:hypothetical protein